MNHDKLKDYLLRQKSICDINITQNHRARDFTGVQYWLGKKHLLVDISIFVGLNLEQDIKNEDS